MERYQKGIMRLDSASGVDLSDGVGLAVGIDASGNATLGGDFGVVTETYQDGATVALFGANVGPVDVKLAGTVAAGNKLVRNGTTGKWTAATAADVAEARAIESGVADELVAAILLPPASAIGASVFAAGAHDHDELYEPLGS